MLSGPSGVGKGSVLAAALALRPELRVGVSMTTRPPRPGETEGVDYFFVTREEFAALVREGQLLEHAKFSGNWYGTPRAQVLAELAAGATVVLEIDLAGARQVKQAVPEAFTVFVEPPSMVELANRLRSRGTEDGDEVDRRLRVAESEVAQAHEFDAVLVNTDIVETAQALLDLLDASEV